MIETIKDGDIIPLTFDIMFTEIFNNEDCLCVLEEFVAGYFNYPLESVRGNLKILSRRLPKENRIDSRKKVDLLLNLNGRKINIEMSNSRSNGVVNRNIVYLCKIYGEQLKYGDDSYSNINESVQIVFNTLRNEAREEGHAEGWKEESWYIALNMLREGISISMISKCTNLSEEEIEQLK